MFIEQRTYTLRPGNLERFWELQVERGFKVVEPIMERLVGYFGHSAPEFDQVVHLWRYDSHDDWRARVHGLYGKRELDTYFQKVRALMLAQENMIFMPAPWKSLTPILGNGNDWLPGDGPLLVARTEKSTLVEIETINFSPGALPAFWSAVSQTEDELAFPRLLGGFSSMIGRLHQLVLYRLAEDDAPTGRPSAWTALTQRYGSLISSSEKKVFEVPRETALSPLFFRSKDSWTVDFDCGSSSADRAPSNGS